MAEEQPEALANKVKTISLDDFVVTETKISHDVANTNPEEHTTKEKVSVPNPELLPRTLYQSFRIKDVVTDLSVMMFVDRVVFTVSQMKGRIASWILCKPISTDVPVSQKLDFDVSHLLGSGRDDPLLTVYAKQLSTKIREFGAGSQLESVCPPVLLGLSLKPDRDPKLFHTILDLLVNLYIEANAKQQGK